MNDSQAARIDSMTTDAPDTTNKVEKKRGYEEGSQKIELLRARWPKAFPAKSHEVRPLAIGAPQALVDEFGWSNFYARAVLTVWKMRPAYCQAILRYPTRMNLDGSPSGEDIDDAARAMAQKQLERQAARKAEKARRAEQDRLRAAAEASAEPKAQALEPVSAPTVIADAKPEPAAPADPPKPRKLLVAGSAAMEAALKRRLAGGAMTTEVLKTVAAPSTGHKRERQAR
jgi:sRNA-binding protein